MLNIYIKHKIYLPMNKYKLMKVLLYVKQDNKFVHRLGLGGQDGRSCYLLLTFRYSFVQDRTERRNLLTIFSCFIQKYYKTIAECCCRFYYYIKINIIISIKLLFSLMYKYKTIKCDNNINCKNTITCNQFTTNLN